MTRPAHVVFMGTVVVDGFLRLRRSRRRYRSFDIAYAAAEQATRPRYDAAQQLWSGPSKWADAYVEQRGRIVCHRFGSGA